MCRFENQAEFFGRNRLGRDRAVRPARFAQQQDLFGCGQLSVIDFVYFAGGEVSVFDRSGRAGRDAVAADDTGFGIDDPDLGSVFRRGGRSVFLVVAGGCSGRPGFGIPIGFLLREDAGRADPDAFAAADAGGGVDR